MRLKSGERIRAWWAQCWKTSTNICRTLSCFYYHCCRYRLCPPSPGKVTLAIRRCSCVRIWAWRSFSARWARSRHCWSWSAPPRWGRYFWTVYHLLCCQFSWIQKRPKRVHRTSTIVLPRWSTSWSRFASRFHHAANTGSCRSPPRLSSTYVKHSWAPADPFLGELISFG